MSCRFESSRVVFRVKSCFASSRVVSCRPASCLVVSCRVVTSCVRSGRVACLVGSTRLVPSRASYRVVLRRFVPRSFRAGCRVVALSARSRLGSLCVLRSALLAFCAFSACGVGGARGVLGRMRCCLTAWAKVLRPSSSQRVVGLEGIWGPGRKRRGGLPPWGPE